MGFLSSILTLLGWNHRIVKLEEGKADTTVTDALQRQIDALDDEMKEDRKYIRSRLDAVFERLVNGK